MDNIQFDLPIRYENWFDSLEEARSFIYEKTIGMDSATVEYIFTYLNDYSTQVDSMAFIDLNSLKKYDFNILVNNGVYEVHERTREIIPFYEYCKWGDFENFVKIIRQSHSPKFFASGFITAISNDQIEIVQYFVENKLVPVGSLHYSPLYAAVNNKSMKCFKYLSNHFDPKENLLPYILEKDALEILKFYEENPVFKRKVCSITLKDWLRIKRDLENPRLNNETIKFFKINLIDEIKVDK